MAGKSNYGYMAKIGVDGSGLQAGLKEIDDYLKDLDSALKSTNKALADMESAGGDTTELLAQKFDILGKSAEATQGKFEMLKDAQEQVNEAYASSAIDFSAYTEFNNTLAETEARSLSLQSEFEALQSALSEDTQAFNDSRDAVLGYTTAVGESNELISAAKDRLAALDAEREAGRAGIEEDTEAHQLYVNALQETEDKLVELESRQEEVTNAFVQGTISADEYKAFQDELANTAKEYVRLQDELDKSTERMAEHEREMSGEAQAERDARESVLSYKEAIEDSNETISANQERLKALREERAAGRTTVTQDIEAHRLYRDTLRETEAKLKDLESRQAEVKAAFQSGTISADEYKEFQKELGDTAKSLEELRSGADNAGQSTLQLGDIISANLISNAIMAGLSALLDIVREVGAEIRETVTQAGAMGDTIDKQSQRLGMTTEAYQEWSYILSQNGADISTLTTSMRTLTNQVDGLMQGSEKATEAFGKLGLSMQDLQGKTGEEQLSLIIQRLQMIDDETERNAVANDLLGRSYQQLIPLLNQDAATIDSLREKAHDTNQIMSEEAVKAAVAYTDAMDTLNKSFDGFENRIGAELLPGITEIVEGFTDLLNGVDGADEKIQEGLDNLMEGADRVLPMIETLLDNIADAAGEKAPEIITSMVTKLAERLPDIAQGLVGLASVIVGAIEKVLPDVGKAAGSVVVTISNSILDLLANPQTFADLFDTLVKTGSAFCEAIADGVMHYDWGQFTEKLLSNLADTFDEAQKYVQVWMDNTFSGGELYGGDINNVANSEFWEMHRKGSQDVVDYVSGVTEYAAEKYDEGKKILDEYFDAYDSSIEENAEAAEEEGEVLEEAAESMEEGVQALDTATTKAADLKKKLQAVYRDLEIEQKENKYDDGWLLARQKAYLDTLDKSSDLYKEYYNKWLDDKQKYEDKQTKQSEKDIKDRAAKEKQALKEYFRDLEIIKKEQGFDEEWLLEQQKAYLDTLDKDSELYKEYYDKWLDDFDAFEKKRQKAEDKAATDRLKEYEKTEKDGEKAAQKLHQKYEKGLQDILSAAGSPKIIEEAKKNTLGLVEALDPENPGQKKDNRRLVLNDYRSKLKELKEYQSNLEKLKGLGLSVAHLKEIFGMDFETRALYIKELLRMGEGQRNKYLSDYEAYTKAAGVTSYNEVEMQSYEIRDLMGDALDKTKDNAYVKGQEAAEAYFKGFKDELVNTDLSEADLKVYTGMTDADLVPSMFSSGIDMVSTAVGYTGDIRINIAGVDAIKMTINDLITKLKNSGGVLDV